MRNELRAGFIPKPGIPHNIATIETIIIANVDGFNSDNNENAANNIAKPPSDSFNVFGAPILSVK
ncbi:hypothetical protein SPD79_15265 [Oceanobacillus sp. SE10311]